MGFALVSIEQRTSARCNPMQRDSGPLDQAVSIEQRTSARCNGPGLLLRECHLQRLNRAAHFRALQRSCRRFDS